MLNAQEYRSDRSEGIRLLPPCPLAGIRQESRKAGSPDLNSYFSVLRVALASSAPAKFASSLSASFSSFFARSRSPFL